MASMEGADRRPDPDRSARLDQLDQRDQPDRPAARSTTALDTVVAEAARAAAADDEDAFSGIAVVAAVDELIALDPTRPGSWFLAGFVEGIGLRDEPVEVPAEAEAQHLAGAIVAAAEADDGERLIDLARSPRTVELVADGVLGAATCPLLLALLRRDAVAAASLAARAPHPFPAWADLVKVVRRRAGAMRQAGNHREAVPVLAGVGRMLDIWSAAGAPVRGVDAAVARVRLDRAVLARETGAFGQANGLLADLPETLLPRRERATLWTERALARLRVARLEDLPVPGAETGDGVVGFPDGIRPWVEAALARDPADPVANLLGAGVAAADGETARAGSHLERTAAGLDPRGSPEWHATVIEAARTLLDEPT